MRVAVGTLEYRTILATRAIRLDEIKEARIKTISTSKGKFQRLDIYSKAAFGVPMVKINPKVFSRADIIRLFDILGEKLTSPRELGIYVKKEF